MKLCEVRQLVEDLIFVRDFYKNEMSERDRASLADAANLIYENEIILSEENKYRWHDLRKNPQDLPAHDGLYCVAVKYDIELTDVGFGQWENMYGYGSGWSVLMPTYGDVIAWKKIESFKGEDE